MSWVDRIGGLSVDQDIALIDDGLRLRLSARTSAFGKGLVAVRFPILGVDYGADDGADGRLVLPRGNLGIVCGDCRSFGAMYPTMYQTMPWFGALKGKSGLYVGAHDPSGGMKRVVVFGPKGSGRSYFEIYPEDSGAPGNAIEPDWSFDISPICAERGWPALAHHYKQWVTNETDWGRAPLLRNRSDVPLDLRDGAWWFNQSILPEGGIELLEEGAKRFRRDFPNLPTVHHWYEWHSPGMDRGFPDHLPKPGTKEAIARLEADPNTRILLFTNATHTDQSTAPVESGRPPCDRGASQFPRYWHDTLQRWDGSRVFVVGASRACLAAMDLSAQGWQSAVLRITHQVIDQLGASGVYLDVIGNVSEGSWTSIRHPAGRGRWVTQSARDLVRAISTDAPLVVVEGALEQMVGIAFAGVNYIGSTSDMAPLFPLVYHERFVLAGMSSLPPDDRHALRMKNGLAFSWGLQMGLNSLQWYEPDAAVSLAWANKLLLTRRQFSNWLAYGEYLGPIEELEPIRGERVESKSWGAFIDDRPVVAFARSPVEASLYRGADGRYSIIFVNLSERRSAASFRLPNSFDGAKLFMVPSSGRMGDRSEIAVANGRFMLTLPAGEILRVDIVVGASAAGVDSDVSLSTTALRR